MYCSYQRSKVNGETSRRRQEVFQCLESMLWKIRAVQEAEKSEEGFPTWSSHQEYLYPYAAPSVFCTWGGGGAEGSQGSVTASPNCHRVTAG